MSNDVRVALYNQMKNELQARKTALLAERKTLESAASRLSVIDFQVKVIDEELAEYDTAIKSEQDTYAAATKGIENG